MVMQYKVGLQNVGSYQVSGKPWAEGGIDATSPTEVEFPEVTSWVQITNTDNAILRVGSSELGVTDAGTNYLDLPQGTHGPFSVKVTQLHLSGGAAGTTSVMAGLTFIPAFLIDNPNVSPASPYLNWSGSSGVG